MTASPPAFLRATALLVVLASGTAAAAENLYRNSNWSAMGADRRASAVGDVLTVVIFQAAEASNTAQNNSSRDTNVGGGIRAGSVDETASLQLGGRYAGRGEVRRSERLVGQLTVVVEEVRPSGDLVVAGTQIMRVNGETTRIGVRGRVRPEDIRRDNSLLSSRIADAEIDYNGRGFVSRSARPGLINRLFSFLGLG